ncbi:hypothetical protein AHF37_01910 [Paragonimus kellicotti]|nr:hypothetical protein AHF37_01910 [Paragonimus kellicotti]
MVAVRIGYDPAQIIQRSKASGPPTACFWSSTLAFGSDSSFSEYISDGWNQLDCLAIGLFSIGFALRIQAYGHVQQIGETALLTMQLGMEGNQTDPTVIPSYHIAENSTLFVHDTYWANAPGTGNQSTNFTAMVYNVTAIDSTNQCDKNFADRMKSLNCTGSVLITDLTKNEYSTWTVDSPYYILTDELFTIARIFYAMSLFAFFVRLMYIFSFSMVLGPKLVMINRMIFYQLFLAVFSQTLLKNLTLSFSYNELFLVLMVVSFLFEELKQVVHDLLPFLSILLVCQLGYGIAFQSISFANGFFTDYEQDKMSKFGISVNSTLTRKSGLKSLYDVVTRSYFQMLGEFRVDELEGERSISPSSNCRYAECIYTANAGINVQPTCGNIHVTLFCFIGRSLQCNPALESKLTKWEHMIGSRRTRADGEGARKWTGGGTRGEGHAIILRTVGGGTGGTVAAATKGLGRDTAVGRGGVVDAGSLLQGIGPIFGPETMFIEDRFVELGNQLGRFATMEEKLSKIVQTTNGLVKVLKQVAQQQKQMINSLHPKDGRRLVGRGQKRDPLSRKNLIIEAVSNAVAGLSSHCSHIEEKIEEK